MPLNRYRTTITSKDTKRVAYNGVQLAKSSAAVKRLAATKYPSSKFTTTIKKVK